MTNPLERLQPIFAECVGENNARWKLGEPWTYEGHVYATNGAIAIRQRTNEYIPPTGPVPSVDLDKHFATMIASLDSGTTITLPDIGPEQPDSTTCPSCNGISPTPCAHCDGAGRCKCKCGDQHECRICGGYGKRLCRICADEGVVYRTQEAIEVVRGVGLADRFIWLLRRYGHTTVTFVPSNGGGNFWFTIGDVFTTGDIQGIVRPMVLSGPRWCR